MEFKKNPDLAEKPDHAHYPVCRGRLDAIENVSQNTLKVTIPISLLMALLSLLSVPLHVVGWIPLMFTLKDAQAFNMGIGFSIMQTVCCFVMLLFAFLGCTKRKIFTVILFFLYAFMLVSSLFIRLTPFDIITALIGIVGVVNSFGSLKGYRDFKQLRNTEGYPVFSDILAEDEEKKKISPDGYYRDHYSKLLHEKLKKERNIDNSIGTSGKVSGKDPITALSQPVSAEKKDIGEMPELTINSTPRTSAPPSRFKPKREKEGTFSDSPLKNS